MADKIKYGILPAQTITQIRGGNPQFWLGFQSGAKATALQTLRVCRVSANLAERLDCGGSPPLLRGITKRVFQTYGAIDRFSQRTLHWPLSGKPGAFFFGAPSQPAAISAVA